MEDDTKKRSMEVDEHSAGDAGDGPLDGGLCQQPVEGRALVYGLPQGKIEATLPAVLCHPGGRECGSTGWEVAGALWDGGGGLDGRLQDQSAEVVAGDQRLRREGDDLPCGGGQHRLLLQELLHVPPRRAHEGSHLGDVRACGVASEGGPAGDKRVNGVRARGVPEELLHTRREVLLLRCEVLIRGVGMVGVAGPLGESVVGKTLSLSSTGRGLIVRQGHGNAFG